MDGQIKYSKQAAKFLDRQPAGISERIRRAIEQIPQGDEAAWDSIPEVEPDEFDLKMLREIEENPDCRDFSMSDESRVRGIEREAVEA